MAAFVEIFSSIVFKCCVFGIPQFSFAFEFECEWPLTSHSNYHLVIHTQNFFFFEMSAQNCHLAIFNKKM